MQNSLSNGRAFFDNSFTAEARLNIIDYIIMSDKNKANEFEEMIENPTSHQLKAYYDAKEKACTDAMKSTASKNPHNKGSSLAEFWDYVYEQFYQIQ